MAFGSPAFGTLICCVKTLSFWALLTLCASLRPLRLAPGRKSELGPSHSKAGC